MVENKDVEGSEPDGHPIAAGQIDGLNNSQALEEPVGQRYRMLAMHGRDILLFFRPDGTLVEVNAAAVAAYGYSQEELLLKSIHDLRAPETHADIPGEIAAVRLGPIHFETTHVRQDGGRVPVEVSWTFDRIGSEEVILSVVRDISERRAAEAMLLVSENRKSAILNAALDAIITMNHEGKISDFNPAAERIFGHTREKAVGHPLAELIIPERFRQSHYDGLSHFLTTGIGPVLDQRIEIPALHSEGHEFPVELTISCIAGQEPPMFTATLRDITQHKAAEEELLMRTVELRENQTRMLLATESTGVGIWEWNVLTNVVRWDDQMFRIYGIAATPDGHVAYNEWSRAVLPEDLAENDRKLQDLVRQGGQSRREFRIRNRESGLIREIDSVETLRVNEQGQAEWVVGTNLDVTDRRRAEEALRESDERYRAAITAVSDLVWTNNADGLMRGEQRGWEDFTGQVREEYQGHGWTKAIHPDDVEPTIGAWAQAVAEKRTFVFEHRVRRHDGEWRDCSIRAVPILNGDGTVREWVGVHTDITERKRNDNKLQQLAADLAEADRRKDEFLATLAHELRNPLAPLRSGLEFMKLAEAQGASVEDARSMMERQVTQMVRLIDDLMDVSRINSGKIQLQKVPVPLATILKSAVETSRPLVDQMGHKLTVTLPSQPIIVDADMTRLSQVFMNLLNNAAKYSNRGGHIHLTVDGQGKDVVVTVKDTGIGIAADQLPHIFEMFAQVDGSLEKSQSGLGIGLTLVKRLVEKHGGQVEALSKGLGKGSEFVVRLPVVSEVTATKKPDGEDRGAAKSSLRILIVDDNKDLANILSLLLENMGNEIRIAYDGQDGVDLALEYKPDVVLLDIGLPTLNGYEACRLIREQSWGKSVVLIASTGWGQSEDRRRSQEAGFDHHMVKPIDLKDLEKILVELQATKMALQDA